MNWDPVDEAVAPPADTFTADEFAERYKMSVNNARWRLNGLVMAGTLERVQWGGRVRFRINKLNREENKGE